MEYEEEREGEEDGSKVDPVVEEEEGENEVGVVAVAYWKEKDERELLAKVVVVVVYEENRGPMGGIYNFPHLKHYCIG